MGNTQGMGNISPYRPDTQKYPCSSPPFRWGQSSAEATHCIRLSFLPPPHSNTLAVVFLYFPCYFIFFLPPQSYEVSFVYAIDGRDFVGVALCLRYTCYTRDT